MSTLAAIIYAPGFPIDAFMAGCAAALRARGVRLGGVVQHNADGDCVSDCPTMVLEDLATGRRIAISAELGAGASGCALDPAGLAEAGAALASALDGERDLIVINKFGKQEALGRGLRQEIAAAVMAGLPVLISVREDLLAAWQAFAGEDWVRLAADDTAIETWLGDRSLLAA